MPREKIKLYHYSDKGKSLGGFESHSEVSIQYYADIHYPLFRNKIDSTIHKLPDGSYIAQKAIYRDDIVKLIKRRSNDFLVDRYNKEKVIEIYNVDKVKIAEFYNVSIASKLMGIKVNNLHSILTRYKNMKHFPKNKLGVYIKYKTLKEYIDG